RCEFKNTGFARYRSSRHPEGSTISPYRSIMSVLATKSTHGPDDCGLSTVDSGLTTDAVTLTIPRITFAFIFVSIRAIRVYFPGAAPARRISPATTPTFPHENSRTPSCNDLLSSLSGTPTATPACATFRRSRRAAAITGWSSTSNHPIAFGSIARTVTCSSASSRRHSGPIRFSTKFSREPCMMSYLAEPIVVRTSSGTPNPAQISEIENPRRDPSEPVFYPNDQRPVRFIEEIDFDYCASDAAAALKTAAS